MQANYSRRMNGKEVSVGGEIYVLYPFPAFTAANLSGEIAGLLLPAVGALAPLFKDKKLSLDDDLNNIAPQLSAAFAGLSGDKLEKLLKKLLCSQNIVPKSTGEWLTEDQADEIFCGQVDMMYVLAFHVLKENFGGFFERVGSLFGERGQDQDPERYGHLDTSQFGELELRMYVLIKAGLASKWELENCYSLDEALKLYALYLRDIDIQRMQAEELRR